MKILLTGGGTAGHISPMLATLDELRVLCDERQIRLELLWIGSQRGPERDAAERANVRLASVQTGKLRRYLSLENLRDAARVPIGFAQSLRLVRRFKPDVALSTGGYVSVSPVLAARFWRVPSVVHEQTAQIGLANRITARVATKLALSWDDSLQSLNEAQRSRAVVIGNPVRASIFNGDAEAARVWAHFPDEPLPTLYVTGGSQGARILNRAVEGALPQFLEACRVIHQCGKQPGDEQDFDRLTRARAELPPQLASRFCVQTFIRDELKDVFALADLVLSRAGAGTVTELCALGKAAVYVPLVPTGGDEQTKNARLCERANAALVLPQSECSPETLLQTVVPLLRDQTRRQAMGEAARTLFRPGAARALAELTLSLVVK